MLIAVSCVSSRSTVAEVNSLKEAVETNNFEIISDWANPYGLSARVSGIEKLLPPGDNRNNINLIGNANFFRVKNDTLHVELPYYGEQRLSRGYNSESGIYFKGKPSNYKVSFNDKKQNYILEYDLKAKEERYNVTVTLFANKSSTIYVNSTHRSAIGYDGQWK